MKLKISIILCLLSFTYSVYSQQINDLKLDFNSKKQKYGYRNAKNKLVIKHKYTFAESFQENFAVVEVALKFGYIDKKGEFLIGPQLGDAGSFSEGLAYFSLDSKKYGYINKNGKIAIKPKFDGAHDFKNGYAKVLKLNPDTNIFGDNKYVQGLVDMSGSLIGDKWFSFIYTTSDSIASCTIKKVKFNLNLNSGLLKKVGDEKKEPEEMIVVDNMPEFPGGDLGLRKYIAHYVRYPKSARDFEITGKTYTRFAISETGEVVDVSTAKSVHPLLDKESVRVIKSLPNWKPGMKNGKPVFVWYTIPINFQLD